MIFFHVEDIAFRLKKTTRLKAWIKQIILLHKNRTGNLNFIFCSDEYLLKLNKKYLKHKSFTDIITFDTSDTDELIEGDIFISIERVKDNARKLKVGFDEELHRVLIHGVLHLLGYSDKTKAAQEKMRKKEDECLALL